MAQCMTLIFPSILKTKDERFCHLTSYLVWLYWKKCTHVLYDPRTQYECCTPTWLTFEKLPVRKSSQWFRSVQDDFLRLCTESFEKQSMPVILSPFFAVLLSATILYVIPSYFQPKSKNIEEQIVEYADWSIVNSCIKACNNLAWQYDLRLIGDHGN